MNKHLLIAVVFYLVNGFSARSQWVQTTTLPVGSISALATIGTNLFAASPALGISSESGIYFSPDNGVTWSQRNGNFPTMEVYTLVTNGSDLFAGTGGVFGSGVYKSSDLGITWVDVTPTEMIRFSNVTALTLDGTDIYASTDWPYDSTVVGSGVFKSSIIGIDSSSWTPFSTGFLIDEPSIEISCLKVHGTKIYAGVYGRGIWISSTAYAGWTATSGMAVDGDYVSVIHFNGAMGFTGNISGTPVLYRSVDNGMNWTQSSTSIFNDKPVCSIISDQTTVYAGTEGNGVVKSSDNGITWTAFNEGFKDQFGNWACNSINVRSLALTGNTLFAGTDCGVWKRQLAAGPVPPAAVADSVFTIYPNPSGNTITLKIGRDHIGSTCIIKDAAGNIMIQRRLTNETTSVETSGLSAGIYFVQVGNSYKRSVTLLKQ